MDDQLELSVCQNPGPEPILDLLPLVERFGLKCRLRTMRWENAWNELVRVALDRVGPNVSQIGTTWVGNFAAMDVLRPFTMKELEAFGGPSAFLASSWETVLFTDQPQIWAIPWLADLRVIYYWRDLLEQAGVDEQTAFQSADHVAETFSRLRASGMASPWITQISNPVFTLHTLASWVWGAGGDFVTADGRQTLFNRAEARAGFRSYMSLCRYLPPNARELDDPQGIKFFFDRQAAVTLSGSWLPRDLRRLGAPPELLSRLGVARPPGPTFVGGSNLVVWQSTPYPELALKLIHALLSEPVQAEYGQSVGQLPVRLEVLAQPPFSTDARFQVMVEALKTGRPLPRMPRWGVVEERLVSALTHIVAEVAAQPEGDLDAIIGKYLEPLARRLDIILGI
jgi:multiple sugar transport system substrate-binding protein